VVSRDQDIKRSIGMVVDLHSRNVDVWIFVNNHFEGSAPRTIEKILGGLSQRSV